MDIIIKWIDISIKTQSHIRFNITSGLRSVDSDKQYVYAPKQKGKLNIDETFKFFVNIDFDSRKDRFVTKPIILDLFVLTSKQNKLGGKNEIDLSNILNEERTGVIETKKIMRCLDKNAKINYSVKLNYKGETPENLLEESIIQRELLDPEFLNLTVDTFDLVGVPKFIKDDKRSPGRSCSLNRSRQRSRSPAENYEKKQGYFDYKRMNKDAYTNESSEIMWTKSYESDHNLTSENPNILLTHELPRKHFYKTVRMDNNYIGSEERLYTEIPNPIRQDKYSPNKTYDFEICPNSIHKEDLKYNTEIKSSTPDRNAIRSTCYNSVGEINTDFRNFEKYKEAFDSQINTSNELEMKLDTIKKENTIL